MLGDECLLQSWQEYCCSQTQKLYSTKAKIVCSALISCAM